MLPRSYRALMSWKKIEVPRSSSGKYPTSSITKTFRARQMRKSYGDWGSIFGDSIIATAILDRLLHHSTTINIHGESYRLKDRRRDRGDFGHRLSKQVKVQIQKV